MFNLKRFFFIPSESLPDFSRACSIDLDGIASQLEIATKAETAARNELPRSEAKSADGTEREIQNYFAKRMSSINAIANERLSRYNTSIVDTNLQDEQAVINNQTNHTKLEINSIIKREFRYLEIVKQKRDGAELELETFKRAHNLQREAYYPESQVLYIAVILFIWLLESIVNGYFFAKGSEFGLLGGVTQAALIAAVNITPAFFIMGSLFRFKNHTHGLFRLIAYLGLVLYAVLTIGFNLFVAHYRDLYVLHAEQAGNLAVHSFMQTPWQLAEFDSWLLFVLGLLFSLLAFVDGYKRDDPYPGYGKMHRRLQAEKQHYEVYRLKIVQQIEQLRQKFITRLELMNDNVQKKHTRLVHLVEDKQAFIRQHQHGIVNFIQAANAMIHQYREANMAVRSTPPPAYFNEEWQPDQAYQLRGDQDDHQKVEEQSKLYQEFPHYAQQRANEIEILYAGFFKKLQELDPGFEPVPDNHHHGKPVVN